MKAYFSKEEKAKLIELRKKPVDYKFVGQERELIKRFVLANYRMIWATVLKPCTIGAVVCAIYNGEDPKRRGATWKAWEVIKMTTPKGIELEEIIDNFGVNNRIFYAWNFHSIDKLVHIYRTQYNYEVPTEFVEHCRNLGYGTSYQATLNFD